MYFFVDTPKFVYYTALVTSGRVLHTFHIRRGGEMLNSFSTMIITVALDGAAKALRHPEEFNQASREALAIVMEDLAKKTKGMLTGALMDEAVRETTTKEGE